MPRAEDRPLFQTQTPTQPQTLYQKEIGQPSQPQQMLFQGRVVNVPAGYVPQSTPYQRLQSDMPLIKAQVPQGAKITDIVPTKGGYDISYVMPQPTQKIEPLEPWFGKGATPLSSVEIALSEMTFRGQWDPAYKARMKEATAWTQEQKIMVEQARQQQMETAATVVSVASIGIYGAYMGAKAVQFGAAKLGYDLPLMVMKHLPSRFFYKQELITTQEPIPQQGEDSFSILMKTKEGWMRKTLTPMETFGKDEFTSKPISPEKWASSQVWKDSGTVHTPFEKTFGSNFNFGGQQFTQQVTRQATQQVMPTLTMVTQPTLLTSLAKAVTSSITPLLVPASMKAISPLIAEAIAKPSTTPFLVKYQVPALLPTYAMKQGKEVMTRFTPLLKPYPEQKLNLQQYPTEKLAQTLKSGLNQISGQSLFQGQTMRQGQFESQLLKQEQTQTQTQLQLQKQMQKQIQIPKMLGSSAFGNPFEGKKFRGSDYWRRIWKTHPIATAEEAFRRFL